MLLKIFESIEISKNEISRPIAASETDSEIQKEKICEICKSKKFWIQKKSTVLRCCRCDPPRSESIVDRYLEPSNQVAAGDARSPDENLHLAGLSSRLAQSYGPYVTNHLKPICECGCDWTHDSGTFADVKSFCVECGKEVAQDVAACRPFR